MRTPFQTEFINITKTKEMNKTISKNKDMNKTIPKTKTEDKDMLDKINNKISVLNETTIILIEIKVKVRKKNKFIYESMCELQDVIYSDDS